MIRSRQLYERGHILQLGSRLPAISAFLAEANERLDVADFTLERLDRVVELTKFIGLDVAMHRLKATGRLPFGDGTFDGVWLDGEMLYQADRKYFLEEVRRVLRPAGKMHVRRAFGPGEVLRRMLVNRSGEGGRGLDSDALRRAGIDGIDHVGAALPERCLRAPGFEPGIGSSGKAAALASGIADAVWARRALLAGTRHDGPGNFFVAGDLRRIMRLCGFAVDQTVAIHRDAAAVEGGGKTLLEHVGEDEEISGAVGRYLNKSVNGDEAHFTIDNFLSFNVVSDEGIRKEMYKSMQSGNVLTS
jgi:SAM-dependent methyltransferase